MWRDKIDAVAAVAIVLLGLITSPARAQVISDPNQIVGDLGFSNVNPDVLAILGPPGNRGLASADMLARLQAAPFLTAGNSATIASPLRGQHEVTVESHSPGIPYGLSATARLGHGGSYLFGQVITDPVQPEPAPDVRADLLECAGLVHVRFESSAGNPIVVHSLGMSASNGYGINEVEVSESYLVVRGSPLVIRVTFTIVTGSDPMHDTLTQVGSADLVVPCDEIVELPVIVRTPGDPTSLGRIIGDLDVLGQDEEPTTYVNGSGPCGNSRFDVMVATPASGTWELENLMPSDCDSPPRPWRVTSSARFGMGRRRGTLTWPEWSSLVSAGTTVDAGDWLVTDPGYLTHRILLAGPPASADRGDACLEDLGGASAGSLGAESDGDGTPAPGAPVSAFGMHSTMGGDGSYDAASETFRGDVELVVGAPRREAGYHYSNKISFQFVDRSAPGVALAYHDSGFTLSDRRIRAVLLRPGDRVALDRHLCLGQVNLSYRALAGTFFDPAVESGSGHFTGVDFEGTSVEQGITLIASHGTPTTLAGASDMGLVVLALPQGDYTLQPRVTSVNPGGGTSSTQLAPVSFSVGCRQAANVDHDIHVVIASGPPCAADLVVIEGHVVGVRDIASVTWSLNGGPENDVCRSCGMNPAFSFLVGMPDADTAVRVTATDANGVAASTTVFTRFAREPSAGDVRAGAEPLRVRKSGASELLLTWEDIPGAGADAYQGTLANLFGRGHYDHGSVSACRVTGGTATLPMPAFNAYYLVGGYCAWGETSLGRDSLGRNRPGASPRCP